jgi:hypothetical protein
VERNQSSHRKPKRMRRSVIKVIDHKMGKADDFWGPAILFGFYY